MKRAPGCQKKNDRCRPIPGSTGGGRREGSVSDVFSRLGRRGSDEGVRRVFHDTRGHPNRGHEHPQRTNSPKVCEALGSASPPRVTGAEDAFDSATIEDGPAVEQRDEAGVTTALSAQKVR